MTTETPQDASAMSRAVGFFLGRHVGGVADDDKTYASCEYWAGPITIELDPEPLYKAVPGGPAKTPIETLAVIDLQKGFGRKRRLVDKLREHGWQATRSPIVTGQGWLLVAVRAIETEVH